VRDKAGFFCSLVDSLSFVEQGPHWNLPSAVVVAPVYGSAGCSQFMQSPRIFGLAGAGLCHFEFDIGFAT
jgi:hypothetical protein